MRAAVVVERARLRFTGWLDVPVIEHEFTCQLDGDELEVPGPSRGVGDPGESGDSGGGGGDGGGGEGGVVSPPSVLRLLRGETKGATLIGAPPLDDDEKHHRRSQLAMEPRWFDESSVPYHEMPDDDQHWYPPALALAAKAAQTSSSVGGGGGDGGGGVRSTDGVVEAEVAGAGAGWETTREIIVGEFHFEGDELARHQLTTISTDA